MQKLNRLSKSEFEFKSVKEFDDGVEKQKRKTKRNDYHQHVENFRNKTVKVLSESGCE